MIKGVETGECSIISIIYLATDYYEYSDHIFNTLILFTANMIYDWIVTFIPTQSKNYITTIYYRKIIKYYLRLNN